MNEDVARRKKNHTASKTINKHKLQSRKVNINGKSSKKESLLVSKKNINFQGKKNGEKCDITFKEKIFSREFIIYFFLFIIDIVLIIYVARRNVVNYVIINGHRYLIGEWKNLFLGRNYVSLFVTLFTYSYFCLVNYFFLQKKRTKRFLAGLMVGLLTFNLLLFYWFTYRIY